MISNRIHFIVWDPISHPSPNFKWHFSSTAIEVRSWMRNYIPLFYVAVSWCWFNWSPVTQEVRAATAMGLLPDTQNSGLRMRRECQERFPRHRLQRKPLVSDPGMHDARALMHVGIAIPRWRGKRSRHSRRMLYPQFNMSGKRPMALTLCPGEYSDLITWRVYIRLDWCCMLQMWMVNNTISKMLN